MPAEDTPPRPLNVIWRRGVLDQLLEAAFIRDVVLSKLTRPTRWIAVEDSAVLPMMDDVLVCSFGDTGGYLHALRDAGHRNIGVFHLGDETGTDDIVFYHNADYVLRHYYFPDRLTPPGGHCRRVIWVPNGWARGVGPQAVARHLTFDARRHNVFFAGYGGGADRALTERDAMLQSLRNARIPATIILSEGFGQGLGRASYAAYMGDSRHALIPAGNSPETIRLYDALECGALPVMVEHPWMTATDGLGALGPPPIVCIDNWDQLGAIIERHAAPGAIEARERQRRAVSDWWTAFKDHVATTVADVIEGAFTQTNE